MTQPERKTRLIVILGALICAALALLLTQTSSKNRDLQSRAEKRIQNLESCRELAAGIRILAKPDAESLNDSEAYAQLLRASFPYDLADQYTDSMRVIKDDKTDRQSLPASERVTRTITFEDLTLQELISILRDAEKTAGILISEINPLAPMPQRPWQWKATVKLVAEKKVPPENTEESR